MGASDFLPDPTADLHWNDFRGAIHDIFASNAERHPDRTCVVETQSRSHDERKFTYRHINESSNQLAHHFLAHGCSVGDVVMIYAYRGVDLVVAYMGALKAGATVSVLDPQYPPERQKVLLDVARPKFLVSIRRTSEEFGKLSDVVVEFISNSLNLKASVPALNLENDGQLQGGVVDGKDCLEPQISLRSKFPGVLVGPDTIPTLSFTSGSEGRPKGVQGRHFSLTYYFPWMAKRFGLSNKERFSMLSGIAHDPIQRDIFTPLFLGAQLFVPPAEVITYELLAEWMQQHDITVTHLTPAMGQILVGGATAQFPSLRNAFFVGDLLTKKDSRRLRELAPNTAIINLYGSTESQRAVSFFEVPNATQNPNILDSLPDVIPVGQGMLDVQLLVINREDKTKQCDVGEQGELYIRAGGLSEGYLGEDERTIELNTTKFVSNWFVDPAKWRTEYENRAASDPAPWAKYYKGPRDRLYRTGDLGRRREDGSVECTGRADSQVKIRGFRIELGEIDATLSQHPFVRENVTIVRRDKNEEQTLVTYFVPETERWLRHLQERQDQAPTEPESAGEEMIDMLKRFRTLSDDCKGFLAERIPKYAVPSMMIPLVRMPLNPNGKIDKPALPFPDEADLAALVERRMSSLTTEMTDTQKRLAKVWASILPIVSARTLAPDSNFFDLGGHSILSQKLFFQLKKEWQDINLPVSVIFQSPTLEALAAEIDRVMDPIGLRLDTVPVPTDQNATDEAYAADARDLSSQLPEAIPSSPAYKADDTPTVLLTGATGFLGSYVVHELLTGPSKARVIAHVRAKDEAAGLQRLQNTLKAYGLWSDDWLSQSRLSAVVGDISKPQLGLSHALWDKLSGEVDVVIHNGAQVNWMLPYSSLRAANVQSTVDCIRLCATQKPKRIVFVSSTSTLDSDYYIKLWMEERKPVLESDDLEGSRKGLSTGYGQTKWASEYLMREAGRRGLTGAVVRPGYITGDPSSGISVTDDFLVRLWKGCNQTGARPNIPNTLNAVPVDQVARIVVAAGYHLDAVTGQSLAVAQVTGHPRPTLNGWLSALDTYGYDVPVVSYGKWVEKVKGYVEGGQGEEFALLPLFHFVTADLPADSIAPEMDDANAAAALKLYANGSGTEDVLSKSTVTEGTMGAYVAYLAATGFMPLPKKKGTRELPAFDTKRLEALAGTTIGGRTVR